MAMRTFDHLYGTYEEAVEVVAELNRMGIPPDAINLIESDADARLPSDVADDAAQNPAIAGATLGGTVGAGIGALVGVDAISMPFVSPLAAGGWLLPCAVLAVVGAVLGGAVGAVTRLGVTNRRAHSLAAGLQRGDHLVMVRADDAYGPRIEAVMQAPHRTGNQAAPAHTEAVAVEPSFIAQQSPAPLLAEHSFHHE